MRIPGVKWLRQNARWLRSRLTAGVMILGYHRIASIVDDPFQMCVRPDHFEQHLTVIKEWANPIRLDQLADLQKTGPLPPRSVILTFDDGYLDNLQNARPLLARYQIPATLFITTGFLGRLFWWDELAKYVLESASLPEELVLIAGNSNPQWSVRGQSGNRIDLLYEIYHCLLPLDAKTRRKILDQIHAWSDLDSLTDKEPDARCMKESEIRRMADGDLVTIGAHTVTHPRLTDLSAENQKIEMEQSKKCLEEIIERPVQLFSYPNGSFNQTTQKILEKAGFTAACTSDNDIARPASDPFRLPRFWAPDWDGERFGRWLNHWLAA